MKHVLKFTVTFYRLVGPHSMCELEAASLKDAHDCAKAYCKKHGFTDYYLVEDIH